MNKDYNRAPVERTVRLGELIMQTTRHWTDDKETVFSANGELKENGDFSYDGAFGKNTIYKGRHFETERDAANYLIREIDADIRSFEAQKARIANKYLYKQYA
jgi:hypothetical protein